MARRAGRGQLWGPEHSGSSKAPAPFHLQVMSCKSKCGMRTNRDYLLSKKETQVESDRTKTLKPECQYANVC